MRKILKYTCFLLLPLIIITGFNKINKSVYIEGYDRLTYSEEEIIVSPGERMQVTLKTVSKLPANQMAHNWVLLKKGTNASDFINKGLDDKTNEYIDPSTKDQVIVKTSMLSGGEEETLSFEAPEESGKYMYVCTFPGHFQAGMKGWLVVD